MKINLLTGIIFSSLLFFCSVPAEAQQTSGYKKINYKIIRSVSNTWGYDIYADNKLLIHQPARPVLPGNLGFKTKTEAEKVAKLVAAKIKKGEMPPTLTEKDLQKLGIRE